MYRIVLPGLGLLLATALELSPGRGAVAQAPVEIHVEGAPGAAPTAEIVSHALARLDVGECELSIRKTGEGAREGATEPEFLLCEAGASIMPGDTITISLPPLPSGEYRVAGRFHMPREGLPPLVLQAGSSPFRVP